MLLLDLADLELGEALQAQVEDRARLHLGEVEPGHEAGSGLLRVGAAPDELDDLVEVSERDEQSLEDVRALLGPVEAEPRPPGDDLFLVVEVVPDEGVESEGARGPVDEGDGVDAERHLRLGVLVDLVERDLRNGIPLELDDHAQPVAAALVAHVLVARDLRDDLVLRELGELAHELGGADLVRQLGEDDRVPAVLERLVVRPRAQHDAAPAGAVGVRDAAASDDEAAGREVRAVDVAHQAVHVRFPGRRSWRRWRRRSRGGCAAGCSSRRRRRCPRSRSRGAPGSEPGRTVGSVCLSS